MSVVQINTNPTRRQLNQFGCIWLGFLALFGVIASFKFHNPVLARWLWIAAVVVPIVGWVVPAFIAAVRAWVTFSSVSRSCVAYPFTVSTRFGMRS